MTSDTLLSALASIAQEAEDNLVLLILTGVLTVAALYFTWTCLRRLFVKVMMKSDDFIPADLSASYRTVGILCSLLVSAMVLAGAGIALASLLGADTTDTREWLKDFGAGVGEWARERVLKVLLILGAGWLLMRVSRKAVPQVVGGFIARQARPDAQREELQKREKTLEGALVGIIQAFLVLIAAFMVLSELGLNIAPLLAAAGIAGIAIGLGAQALIRDILSGMFILLEDQYRVGDVVIIGGHGGMVEEVTLRRTVLRDLEFVVHVISNSEIRDVKNLTKEKSRVKIDVPVAYKEDLDRCFKVINRVGEEIAKDPKWAPLITERLQALRVDDFGESAIMIRVLGQTLPLRQWDVAGEFRLRIKRAFDEEGIEIPFPHRTIYWGNGQAPFRTGAMPAKPGEREAGAGAGV